MTEDELVAAIREKAALGHQWLLLTVEKKTPVRSPFQRVKVPPFRGYGRLVAHVEGNRYMVELPMVVALAWARQRGYAVEWEKERQ